jgi:FKBP-type peptidyl-prolyl cis-trans isomerase 2
MEHSERIGKAAHILYKGGIKGERMLDDRSTGEPLVVVIGEGRIPKGIEEVLYEMHIGEQRQIEVPCSLGFGEHKPEGLQWYPKSVIDHGYELKVGSVLSWTNPDDHSVLPARVVEETEDNIRIDLNHPFAGKTLEYWIELVDLK